MNAKLMKDLLSTKAQWLAVRAKSVTVLRTRETRDGAPYLILMDGRP